METDLRQLTGLVIDCVTGHIHPFRLTHWHLWRISRVSWLFLIQRAVICTQCTGLWAQWPPLNNLQSSECRRTRRKKKLAFLSPALSDGLPIACHSVMLSLLTFPFLLIFVPSLFPSLSPRRWAFTNYLSPFSISSVLHLPISLSLSLHPAPTIPPPHPPDSMLLKNSTGKAFWEKPPVVLVPLQTRCIS